MISCPDCNGSEKVVLAGLRYVKDKNNKKDQKIQRYLCKICGYRFSEKTVINETGQSGGRQICVSLTEDSKNLTGTEQNQVLRENHKYTAIIEQFKWYMTRKEYSKATIKTRDYHLNKLVELKADLDDPESVETVLALSDWGKSYKKCFINTYQAYCKWRKIFWDAPRIHVTQKIIKLPTVEDVKLLVAGLGKKTGTLTQLLFETGCRIGEGCKLRWEDVDWKNQRININSPEKRGNSRSINVCSELIAKLKALPKRKDGYIFNPNAPSHCAGFFRAREKIAKKLQKPELNNIHFHTLRHLRATLELYREGKHHRDVQYMLGHRSSQSTDRYTHYKPKAPTKWEVKRAITKEEENQLLSENWTYIRYDEIHKEAIYRRSKRHIDT